LESPPANKRRFVREMFSDIAPRYDLLNRVLSLAIDRSWRRRALARLGWERNPSGTYLDACAGTLDLTQTLLRTAGFRGRVLATDFALPMLHRGRTKTRGEAASLAAADTVELPLRAGSIDGAVVGFGLRNLESPPAGLAELARVLKPGARLVILDFMTPTNPVMRGLYLFYFKRILPVVGRLVSGHPEAYTYLPESVDQFPPPQTLVQWLGKAGLTDCGIETLSAGIAAITWGAR
jgi:demethylmenaquinone methyltransferase/2-methoxy-6-polyprenyl-1,4-benzoquinol methylase